MSLGTTLFYLSFYKYKPAIEDEIIHRIKMNLDYYDMGVQEYFKDAADELPFGLFDVFHNNIELVYIRIIDYVKRNRYILYRRNTVNIDIKGKKTIASSFDRKPVKMKKRFSKIFYNESINIKTNQNLYILKDYKMELTKHIRGFIAIHSNFNEFLKLKNNIIKSNQKIINLKIDRDSKKYQKQLLLSYANNEIKKIKSYLIKLDAFCSDEINYFNKNMKTIVAVYSDSPVLSKEKQFIKFFKRNNTQLVNTLKNVQKIIGKKLKNFKNIKKVSHLNSIHNTLIYIKSYVNKTYHSNPGVSNPLKSIDSKINDFKEIKLSFDEKEIKDTKPVDKINIIKTYKMINPTKKKIVGYYEIGISEKEIMKKINPIIISGIKSSSVILIVSIAAALILALYIVYPIYKLDKGADEILKDLNFRIKLNRKDEFGKFAETFNNLSDQITQELSKYQKLYKEATEDELTKLMVRRYFMKTLNSEINNAKKEKRSTALFMTDIDHFKKFNDTYGHQTGDMVLAMVSKVLLKNTRKNRVRNDIAGRYGGEEFVVLLPDTDKEEAMESAERIRKEIKKMILKSTKGETLSVTISIGVFSSEDSNIEPKELIEKADKALYNSKETGRNKVSYG